VIQVSASDENGTHTAQFATPTGAQYNSTAPPLPGVTRIGSAQAERKAA
jgi:hypothetical protein